MGYEILCDRCGKKIQLFEGLVLVDERYVFGGKYYLCRYCSKDFRAFMNWKGGEDSAAD